MTPSEHNEWDDYAAEWDGDAVARAYAAAAYESLLGVLPGAASDLAGARVIDFGCGTGLLTERLVDGGASVDAIDTSVAMRRVLDDKIAERGWGSVTTSSELPTAAQTYDLVVCSSVCAFLDDYPGTVRRLVELLRPGGVFVQWDWERVGDGDDGLTRDEISGVLAAAGLERVGVDTGFTATVGDATMAPLMGHGQRRHGESSVVI